MLLQEGCGYIGVELRGFEPDDAGVHERDPSVRDASAPDASSADAGRDGGAPDAFVDAGPQPCDFAGTWVTKVTSETSWPTGIAIASGSGTSQVWVKHQMTSSGGLVPGSMVICGITMPDFELQLLLGRERYGVDLNLPLFDAIPPKAAATDTVIEVDGAGFPGDPVTMSDTAVVLGARLADPVNDPWPSARELVDVDSDEDGKPGITVGHLNDATHVYLRVSPLGTVRSDRGYYAARVVLSASGSVVSCDELAGQASISRFDTRVVGCSLVGGGECSAAQTSTLDGFRPEHKVDSASYRAIKVADDLTCAAVRSTLP